MNEIKIKQLLDMLTSAAACFAYDEEEPNFVIEVTIICEDGWAQAIEKKI